MQGGLNEYQALAPDGPVCHGPGRVVIWGGYTAPEAGDVVERLARAATLWPEELKIVRHVGRPLVAVNSGGAPRVRKLAQMPDRRHAE